jgi:hypothetical protein
VRSRRGRGEFLTGEEHESQRENKREPTERTREGSGVRGRDAGCRPLNAGPKREKESRREKVGKDREAQRERNGYDMY